MDQFPMCSPDRLADPGVARGSVMSMSAARAGEDVFASVEEEDILWRVLSENGLASHSEQHVVGCGSTSIAAGLLGNIEDTCLEAKSRTDERVDRETMAETDEMSLPDLQRPRLLSDAEGQSKMQDTLSGGKPCSKDKEATVHGPAPDVHLRSARRSRGYTGKRDVHAHRMCQRRRLREH